MCILVAHVFDGLDGRIARLTKSTSRFGIEYDSLVRPGRVRRRARHPRLQVGARAVGPLGLARGVALRRPAARSGWRASTCRSTSAEKRRFIGLPIPAAADTIASTVLLYYFFGGEGATHKHIILLVVIYALAALMVSNVSYNSFKGFSFSARQPLWILVALIVGLKFVIAEPQIFLFTAFLLYALSGPVAWLLGYRKRRRAREEARAKVSDGSS